MIFLLILTALIGIRALILLSQANKKVDAIIREELGDA